MLRHYFEKNIPAAAFAILLLSPACLAGSPAALSSVPAMKADPNTVSLIVENDSPSGSDKDYTSGIRLGWMSSSTSYQDAPGWSSTLGSLIGGTAASPGWSRLWGMDRTPALRQQWGMTLTQLIFTPEDKSREPIYGQHPYAGYLALGVSSLVKNEDRANSFELQLGATGKPSLAKGSQRTVHKILDEEQWPNWQDQLPSEFAFCFYFKRYYRLRCLEYGNMGGLQTDSYFYWHTDLGTVYLRGGVGFNFRFGRNLPETGYDASINGGSLSASPFVKNKTNSSNWGYYGFTGVTGRVVGHDLFLDGTVFHNSPKYVTKYPFVADASLGAGLRYKNLDIIFAYTLRTKEYSTQCNPQLLGTLQIRYSF